MKILAMTTMVLILAGSLAACNKAESPQDVAKDVSSAQSSSASSLAETRQDAAQDTANARARVNEEAQDASSTAAKGAYEQAIAKAEGDRKVAVEKCEALSGQAQRDCKDAADAKLKSDKAAAAAIKPQ